MFNFFKKGKDKIKVVDKIWMTQTAKWNYLVNQKKINPNLLFVFWFDETLREAESRIKTELSADDLVLARQVNSSFLAGKEVIFAEHYPLSAKEEELFLKLNLKEVQVWSALDEPLFKQFGSDKIINMMKQMGMKEDSITEHNMISKAIHNAQEKISKKVLIDQACASQEEWMRKNWTNN